jgi:hypothetical protein
MLPIQVSFSLVSLAYGELFVVKKRRSRIPDEDQETDQLSQFSVQDNLSVFSSHDLVGDQISVNSCSPPTVHFSNSESDLKLHRAFENLEIHQFSPQRSPIVRKTSHEHKLRSHSWGWFVSTECDIKEEEIL